MQRVTERPGANVRPTGRDRSSPDLEHEALWYRDAVIYQVHVRGFFDRNDDGVGDFAGLTAKLDYIQSLGVSAIWLQPFYPSPLRDDGYDIAHYQDVHRQYGTRRDFRAFLAAAHQRGLRVITELVINHTSDQHPWFQAARRAKRGSAKRDFYVWSDTDQRYLGVPIVFKDVESSNWTWDAVAGQYYWHRFFHHQPDLNFDNPRVLRAVLRVMRFWMDMGVDGMRLDAVPYLVEREGTQCANLPETHAILKAIRRELDARYPDRMLLAEANQWPSDVRTYFGDGDECHMAFHFPLMPRLFMALRQEDRHPLSEILYQMPEIPDGCQWATFLRNHDELTLEMVSDEERDYMYQAYAADPVMRLNVGIRRRLAPLMENSRPRIELMTGLLLSLPGTPVLYYGDELGMGDNVYLGDRNGVRTPMQWSADRNGGFSRADPARLYAPPIMDPVYGYSSVNVEAQDRSPHSLLAWMRQIIALRRRHVTFGRGSLELLRPANRRIFAFIRRYESEDPILVVANLSRTVQAVSLDLGRLAGLVPVEMSGGVDLPRIGETPYVLTLGPNAFYWLKLQREPPAGTGPRPSAPAPEPEPEQSPLLLGLEWAGILDSSVRYVLEQRYLPVFLARQPWFERHGVVAKVTIVDWTSLPAGPLGPLGDERALITIVQVTFADRSEARYVIPLTLTPAPHSEEIVRDTPEAVVAAIAGARKGVIHARVHGPVGRRLVHMVIAEEQVRLRAGRLRGTRARGRDRLTAVTDIGDLPAAPRDEERFHSCASFGERVMLKIIRSLETGPNAELELTEFLAETGTGHVPKPVGTLEYSDQTGHTSTAALLFSFVPHQTDGWRNALDELQRVFDLALASEPPIGQPIALASMWSGDVPPEIHHAMGTYAQLARTLGRRVGEMHLALGSAGASERFGAAVMDAGSIDAIADLASASWERLHAEVIGSPRAAIPLVVQELVDRHDEVLAIIRRASAHVPTGLQVTRIHGSLDLAHVLIDEGDVTFIGVAEGQKEAKAGHRLHSPLADVAVMLRSFRHAGSYAVATRLRTAPVEPRRLAAWADWWVAGAAANFLAAYREATSERAFVPADATAASGLMQLLMLDDVFEEVRHSLAAQHTWLEVTVDAAMAALGLERNRSSLLGRDDVA